MPAAHGVRDLPRRLSLRNRLILFAAACLLPLLVVIAVIIAETADAGRDQVLDAQAATAEVVASVLGTTLSDNQKVLQELASIDRVRRMDPGSAKEALDQFSRAHPNLYGLFLLDPQGNLVASTGLDPAQFQITFRVHRCRRSVAQARGTGRLECPDRSRRAGDCSHDAGTDKRSGRGGADRGDRLPPFSRAAGRGGAALCARRHPDRGSRGWAGRRHAGRRSGGQCAGLDDRSAAVDEWPRGSRPTWIRTARSGSRSTRRCRDRHGECW